MGNHYIPQEYLRHFASPSDSDKVWVYDKLTGECKLLPIKNVAQSKGFYTDADEKELNLKVEIPAHTPLRELRCVCEIDPEGRRAISRYIVHMIQSTCHENKAYQGCTPNSIQYGTCSEAARRVNSSCTWDKP